MVIESRGQNTIITFDVTLVPQSDLTMADINKAKRKPRGRYGVAGAPNQQSCQYFIHTWYKNVTVPF